MDEKKVTFNKDKMFQSVQIFWKNDLAKCVVIKQTFTEFSSQKFKNQRCI